MGRAPDDDDALSVSCAHCGAPKGEPCHTLREHATDTQPGMPPNAPLAERHHYWSARANRPHEVRAHAAAKWVAWHRGL